MSILYIKATIMSFAPKHSNKAQNIIKTIFQPPDTDPSYQAYTRRHKRDVYRCEQYEEFDALRSLGLSLMSMLINIFRINITSTFNGG